MIRKYQDWEINEATTANRFAATSIAAAKAKGLTVGIGKEWTEAEIRARSQDEVDICVHYLTGLGMHYLGTLTTHTAHPHTSLSLKFRVWWIVIGSGKREPDKVAGPFLTKEEAERALTIMVDAQSDRKTTKLPASIQKKIEKKKPFLRIDEDLFFVYVEEIIDEVLKKYTSEKVKMVLKAERAKRVTKNYGL